jgi:hypothetical protein
MIEQVKPHGQAEVCLLIIFIFFILMTVSIFKK